MFMIKTNSKYKIVYVGADGKFDYAIAPQDEERTQISRDIKNKHSGASICLHALYRDIIWEYKYLTHRI